MSRVMGLRLDTPIAYIYVETTGLSITLDRVVEIAVLKINPDGSEDLKRARINPQMPIPQAAAAIHRITDARCGGQATIPPAC